VLGGSTSCHLQKFLKYMRYIVIVFTHFTILLHSSLSHFLKEFQQMSFFHLHICVHSICSLFTLFHHFPTFSTLPPIPTYPSPPAGSVLPSCSLILYKKKIWRKNDIFACLRATQGISLWHFHVYMYYSLIWSPPLFLFHIFEKGLKYKGIYK
jgi:hypothetical protein